MHSVPSLDRQHSAAIGRSAQLDLIQPRHIINSLQCGHFSQVNFIHAIPSVHDFQWQLYHFFRPSGRLDLMSSALPPSPSYFPPYHPLLVVTVHYNHRNIPQPDLHWMIRPPRARPPHSMQCTISSELDHDKRHHTE